MTKELQPELFKTQLRIDFQMRKLLRNLWRLITFPFRVLFWFLSLGDLKDALFRRPEDEDSSLPDVVVKVVDNPASILDHLGELRKNLTRSILVLFIATGVSFIFMEDILNFLAMPLEGGMSTLVAIEVTEPIGTVMRVALLTGFAITLPYIAYQIWLFIAPAMIETRNRIRSFIAIPLATIFFLGGMSFAYFVMMPTALPFLLGFMDFTTNPRPSSYIKFTTGLMFWIGTAFEFPLVIFFLASLGIIDANMLVKQWRIAIVIIFVVAALITPTVDPVNMALVAGPLIVLYFLGVLLAMFAQRGRRARLASQTT